MDEILKRLAALEKRLAVLESKAPKPRGKHCGMVRDPETGEKYWLPNCMGGAVYGDKYHCTCK